MNINPQLVALTVMLIGGAGLGIATIMGARVGFDYMFSRGNPRNRAQAHESGVDIVKGVIVVAVCVAGAAAIANTLGLG